MADKNDLFDLIEAAKPSDWVWSVGSGAYQWIIKYCEGFVNMINVAKTTVFTPVGPVPPWPHNHTISTMDGSKIQTELDSLGYSGSGLGTFFSTISTNTATYLKSNITLVLSATATVPHDHVIASVGSAAGLKSAIKSGIVATGVNIDSLIGAIATGVYNFLTTHLGMRLGLFAHFHTLSV